MRGWAAAVLASLAFAPPARASEIDGYCDQLALAIEVAEVGLAGLTADELRAPDESNVTCSAIEILSGGNSFSCEWSYPEAEIASAFVKSSVIVQCMTRPEAYEIIDAAPDELAWKLSDKLTAVLHVPERRGTRLIEGLRLIAL